MDVEDLSAYLIDTGNCENNSANFNDVDYDYEQYVSDVSPICVSIAIGSTGDKVVHQVGYDGGPICECGMNECLHVNNRCSNTNTLNLNTIPRSPLFDSSKMKFSWQAWHSFPLNMSALHQMDHAFPPDNKAAAQLRVQICH